MTPELDSVVEALFAAQPTLLQIQYDPPHVIPADTSHVMAWVSVQGTAHNEDDPSSWASIDFVVGGSDPARDMRPGTLRDDILALRDRCDATPDIVPFVRHRNPTSEIPAPSPPTHDELKMRYASEAVQNGYMTAEVAIETLHIDPEGPDATILRQMQEVVDSDAKLAADAKLVEVNK